MVKLNDGTKVPLEEFVIWSTRKQNNKTMPLKEFEEQQAKRVKTLKRAINTPFGKFSTFKEAIEKTKISSRTLLSLLKNKACPEYSYVTPKPSDIAKEFYLPLKNKNSKKTVTPLGLFDSIAIAAEAHGLSRNSFYKLLNTESANYYLKENGPKPNLNTVRKKSISKTREKNRIRNQFDEQAKSGRSVKTPMGVFGSINEAVLKTGITISPLRRLLYSEEFPAYSILNLSQEDEKKIVKKLTQEEKNDRQRNKAISRSRSIITPEGEFPSVTAASIALKLWRGQLTRLLQNPQYTEYRYSDSKPQISDKKPPLKPNKTDRVRRPDEVITPKGHFVTKIQAALAHKISSTELENFFINKPEKYYLIPLTRQTRNKKIKARQI